MINPEDFVNLAFISFTLLKIAMLATKIKFLLEGDASTTTATNIKNNYHTPISSMCTSNTADNVVCCPTG